MFLVSHVLPSKRVGLTKEKPSRLPPSRKQLKIQRRCEESEAEPSFDVLDSLHNRSVPREICLDSLGKDSGHVSEASWYSTEVTMKELSYTTISTVIQSWEVARAVQTNFESEMGQMVLLRLFEIEPRTKKYFGLQNCAIVTLEDMKGTTAASHASILVSMIDSILSMLGPDHETLIDMLEDVGHRHVEHRVKANYMPFMGRALIHCLSQILGNTWTAKHADAWNTLFDEISETLMKAMF